VCKVANKCTECKQFKNKKHVCIDEKYCPNCKIPVNKFDHRCFVQTEDEKKKRYSSGLRGYIFFDYEASQEKNIHAANLVCAVQLCLRCVSTATNNFEKISCENNCGQRLFLNNQSFCEWQFTQKKYTAIAHNMKGMLELS